ncbi:Gfo/Idh/MocA family oxidoreductase, partial [bacterium]|nr:Gfo/Idh/MocA family oxidoreductase [bacterium]
MHKVAIIGLGRMGSTIDDEAHFAVPYSVAAATKASDVLELVAGADLLPEKREDFNKRWGAAVYEASRQMIDEEKPDLVAICTAACLPKPANSVDSGDRPDSHADLSVAVADMGVPMIFCEKAMASSMARADDIRDAVKRNNTLFNTGVLRRFDNRYAVVKKAIAEGRIGEVKSVVHFAGSSLMHGHIHSIDTVSFLIGDPAIEAVRGELLPRDFKIEGNHIPADPQATYQLRFANGVEAWTIPGGYWEFEVIGSEGSIRAQDNGARVSLRQPGAQHGRRQLWEEVPFPDPEHLSTT